MTFAVFVIHGFCCVVLLLSLNYRAFIPLLVSSLTHSSFNNDLFNCHIFVHLLEMCLLSILNFIGL